MSPWRPQYILRHFSVTFLMVIIVMELCALTEADGLTCYSCSGEWTIARCLERHDPVTCGFGEVCHTTVTRGGFQYLRYDKGCLEKYHCSDLQSLNDRKNCKMDPSVCVYCCSDNLCNTSSKRMPVCGWTVVMTTVLLLWLLR